MKTNREMTESVLHKASEVAAQQKLVRKRAAGIMAGALCMVLIIGMLLVPWGAEQPVIPTGGQLATPPTTENNHIQPTQGEVSISTGKVYFLSNPGTADMLTPLKADTTYSISEVIRVFPKNSQKEANEFLNAWVRKYDSITNEGRKETFGSEKTIIYSLSAGFTSLILPDYTQISKVEMESTGVLDSHRLNAKFHMDHTINMGNYTVTIPAGSYREYLLFTLSNETIKLLDANPETPLSTIRDTFTLTIHYTNGTTESLTFDVYLDDEGQVYTSLCNSSTL